MVSTRKEKIRQKRQISQLKETLKDFVFGNNTNMGVSGNGNLEEQASGHHRDFERIVDNASQNQVIGNNTDDKIRDAVDSVVIVVENRMHDAILTAINDVVIPQVEMTVRPITRTPGNGPNSIVQNPDQRDFTKNTKNTPLRLASSRLDLIIDRDIIDETRDIDDFQDGDLPATRLNYDRRAHAHHSHLLLRFDLFAYVLVNLFLEKKNANEETP